MDPTFFVVATMLIPGVAPSMTSLPSVWSDGIVAVDNRVGDGLLALDGRLATCQVDAYQSGGARLFDTARRGLPFTFSVGATGSETLFSAIVRGMRPGGQRTAFVLAEASARAEMGSVLPPKGTIQIRVGLLSIAQP